MNLATRIRSSFATALVLFALAGPTASAGIDRGIGVEPYVAPSVDRNLANDRAHHGLPAARTTGVSEKSKPNAALAAAVAVAGSSLALGVAGTMLALRRRRILAS